MTFFFASFFASLKFLFASLQREKGNGKETIYLIYSILKNLDCDSVCHPVCNF